MRRAAIRRANFELGIKELDAEKDLKVVSRILYHANSCDTFAEHELDYIIFAKKDLVEWNVDRDLNRDEIESIAWVSLDDFETFLTEKRTSQQSDITPWFRLLKDSKLKIWW